MSDFYSDKSTASSYNSDCSYSQKPSKFVVLKEIPKYHSLMFVVAIMVSPFICFRLFLISNKVTALCVKQLTDALFTFGFQQKFRMDEKIDIISESLFDYVDCFMLTLLSWIWYFICILVEWFVVLVIILYITALPWIN